MSTRYRTSARGTSYLSRITESWKDTVLTPDIITERGASAIGAEIAQMKAAASEPASGQPRNPSAGLARGPIAAPAAGRPAAARAETSIIESRHPEIARAITLLWGFPEMNQYFDRLWMADGNQGPIDPDAMSELMLLARLHQGIVPQSPGRSLASLYGSDRMYEPDGRPRNPWSDVPPRR